MNTRLTLRARMMEGPISTDDIIPGKYKHMYTDPADMARHVFENRFPGYAGTLREGDLIACRSIFGIGSSREQAVTSLLAAGVKAVVAPHFGRIFFRNCWNLGLLPIKIADCVIAEEASVTLDLVAGALRTPEGTRSFHPPPRFMLDMRAEGGLLERVRNRCRAAGRSKPTESCV
ncbi:MAG: hypothetical protein KC636_14130 [Myxococcales bacterium]|nr:hypothetical protein [Myxococcales bacterium]